MSNWNYDSIKEERAKKVVEKFGEASKEQLLERLIELETAIFPFKYTLTAITNADDDTGRYGVYATSKLFAFEPDDQPYRFMKHSGEIGKGSVYLDVEDKDLHLHDYYEEESITIYQGDKLDDSVEILAVHSSGAGCYIGCGHITVGDVRRLEDTINKPYKIVSKTENND